MDDDSIVEIDDLLIEEEPVPQAEDDFRDTEPMGVPVPFRAQTHLDWPPEPPPPAEVDLAQGTINKPVAPVRKAGFFAIVFRPKTSSGSND